MIPVNPGPATDHLTIWLRVGILGGNGHAPRCGSYWMPNFLLPMLVEELPQKIRHLGIGELAPGHLLLVEIADFEAIRCRGGSYRFPPHSSKDDGRPH